jgi:hypothetical protein
MENEMDPKAGPEFHALAEMWELFEKAIRTRGVKDQPTLVLCRSAFMAGAECLLNGFMMAVGSKETPDAERDAAGMAWIDGVRKEITDYALEMQRLKGEIEKGKSRIVRPGRDWRGFRNN